MNLNFLVNSVQSFQDSENQEGNVGWNLNTHMSSLLLIIIFIYQSVADTFNCISYCCNKLYFIELTASPIVFAKLFSVILANGLSAPQHSKVLVIFDEDLFLPAPIPNCCGPFLESTFAIVGSELGLGSVGSPLLELCYTNLYTHYYIFNIVIFKYCETRSYL